MPDFRLETEHNKMTGHCGEIMQLGREKNVSASESVLSEEVKHTNRKDSCFIQLNASKTGFCPSIIDAARSNTLALFPDSEKLHTPEFQRDGTSLQSIKEESKCDQIAAGESAFVFNPLGHWEESENAIHDKKVDSVNALASELDPNGNSNNYPKQIASNSTSVINNENMSLGENHGKKLSNSLDRKLQDRMECFITGNGVKDFQRFVSSGHCIQMMPKLESRTNSDDFDAVTSRPTDEGSRDSHPKPKEHMLPGSSIGACQEVCLDNFESFPAEKLADYVVDTSKCKGIEINEEHESRDSVEGSDNVRTISAGKRKCELATSMRSSKIQKLSDGNASCSESFLKKRSSFMKWIANLMKGLSEVNLDRKFLSENSHKAASVEHENHDLWKTDHDIALCRTRSFQSFFHSMYSPNLRSQDEKLESFDCVRETRESLKIEKTNRRPFGDGSSYVPYGKNELYIQTNIVKPEKRSDHGIGKVSSWSGSPQSQEKYKSNLEGNDISRNIACVFEKGSGSSSNTAGKPVCDIMNAGEPSELATNDKNQRRNLWLARFSQSQSALKPLKENTGMNSSNKALGIVGGDSSLAENGVYAAPKPELIAVGQPPSKIHLDVCFNGMNMHDSRRNKENLQRRQSPIVQPPRRFIKVSDSPASDQEFHDNSTMLSSSTWKELNDPMQTLPPASRCMTSVICFFCGAVGHSIQGCTEMVKNKLEYPLTNITACKSEEDSCFCICCFRLDHWAISCPSKNIHYHGVAPAESVDFGKLKENLNRHDLLEHHNGTSLSLPAAKSSHYWFGNEQNNKVTNPTQSAARCIVRDVELEKNQFASSSGCCEPKENQVIPFCGPRNGEIPEVPREMFDKIRKLQLSRSDILRWMKVPELTLHLEGFFLRLRFRKWDEGLGGGYCVARISGVNQERTHGSHKVQFLVNLEGFTLMVDSRYISNHEFTEEELVEWWLSAMNGSCNVPNEEELRLKIEEKKNLLSLGERTLSC